MKLLDDPLPHTKMPCSQEKVEEKLTLHPVGQTTTIMHKWQCPRCRLLTSFGNVAFQGSATAQRAARPTIVRFQPTQEELTRTTSGEQEESGSPIAVTKLEGEGRGFLSGEEEPPALQCTVSASQRRGSVAEILKASGTRRASVLASNLMKQLQVSLCVFKRPSWVAPETS